jgi:drug/metabolite transporter (DMT)-like permease
MDRAIPLVFVALWSTGFIGSKLGLPHIEPITFLTLRFAIVVPIFLLWAAIARAPWPPRERWGHIAAVGLLLHGFYLGGVFVSIAWGLPAGLSALIVGAQPLLTAAIAGKLTGERVSARQWLGLALGFAGVAAVLWEKLALDDVPLAAVWPSVVGLLGITFGTLQQQRRGAGVHLATGGVIQYSAVLIALIPLMLAFETMEIEWAPALVFAMAWLVLVLSVGAVSLLMMLARRGAAAKTASLFYLVPPCTAAIAWPLFGETLELAAIAGMAVTALGVYLVRKS